MGSVFVLSGIGGLIGLLIYPFIYFVFWLLFRD